MTLGDSPVEENLTNLPAPLTLTNLTAPLTLTNLPAESLDTVEDSYEREEAP